MDLRYNVVKMENPYSRDARQHDHHHVSSASASATASGTGSTRSSDDACSSIMAMYFHFGDVETILFKPWQTDSILTMIASCLVVFIVAILYELLKFYREWLKRRERRRLEGGAHRRRSSRKRRHRSRSLAVESLDDLSLPMSVSSAVPGDPQSGIIVRLPWLAPMHWYQTFLHMVQITISFMLMLVFMTFNVWLCLSVVFGAGLGYFLFFVRDESITDHCN